MEYVHGAALSELLSELAQQRLRLTPAMSVAIAMAAASGLHAAHETRDDEQRLLDVIHRDVSPQNILVGARGDVKLIDFGVAKARDRLHVTDAGSGAKGKLRYMAPEQLQGGHLDRRVDVYALGVVLWEMLAMRRLFQGQTDAEVITRITRGDFPPPGAFVEVPFGLDSVVLKCLAVHPERRPATAHLMRQLLKESVPEAAAIEPGEIAALLWALLGPRMLERAAPLPGVVAALQSIELDLDSQEALHRFTEPLDAVVHDAETCVSMMPSDADAEPTEVSAGALPSVPSPTTPPSGVAGEASVTIDPRGSLDPMVPLVRTSAPRLQPAPEQPSASVGWPVLLLIVLLALLVGAAATFVVLDGRTEPRPVAPVIQHVVPP